MKRRELDFVSLFNALWYRDFPVIPGHEDIGKRAVWTTHIASIVKQSADFLGLFTCYETGGRTDAVIQDSSRDSWAKIEWEWSQPRFEKVNEIEKLALAQDTAEAFIFIGYSDTRYHNENLEKIEKAWANIHKPLIVFLVTFSYHGRLREFDLLQTHYLKNGKRELLRRQYAVPWMVKGSKWAALTGVMSNSEDFELDNDTIL
jgi:hypothetical protein